MNSIFNREMRKNANIKCAETNYQNKRADDCLPLLRPCLFNIAEDPCEMFNLAERFAQISVNRIIFDSFEFVSDIQTF